MKQRYDPNKPDPLGIRAEVERERLKSRFRDSISRRKVHPIQHDVQVIVSFVMERRRRTGRARLDAASRVLNRVDTEALRFLISLVLENGRYDRAMKRRCARLLECCQTIEAALSLRGGMND